MISSSGCLIEGFDTSWTRAVKVAANSDAEGYKYKKRAPLNIIEWGAASQTMGTVAHWLTSKMPALACFGTVPEVRRGRCSS
jgi:hypothetical protein